VTGVVVGGDGWWFYLLAAIELIAFLIWQEDGHSKYIIAGASERESIEWIKAMLEEGATVVSRMALVEWF
jgi:hypothetical protein